ncbi:MAG TPA: TolC family protein [Polyangia bacterium]|nr:TolC family protein [Polyangia bacterium]
MKLLDLGSSARARAVGAGGGVAVAMTVALLAAPAFAQMVAPQPPEAAPEKVTLSDAVARALARNPSVAVASAEIDRAEALIKEARAGWFPTLGAFGSYTRLDHDRVYNGLKEVSINGVSANLTLTIPLVQAPAWTNTRLAKDNRRIAEASAADVRRQVAQATARAYLTVVAQHRLIAAAETARANAKDHYDYAHTRLQGGVGRSIDEVRAQQDLASVDVQVQATYVALARAREALGVLMAVPAPVDSVEEVDLGAMPSLQAALGEASQRRTDIKLLDERVVTAKQSSDDVWAYYAPFASIVAQPFFQDPPTPVLPRTGWQAQLLLSLPLYDGGQRGGISHEREALLAESRANLDAGLRQAQSDVRVSFEEMLRADQGLASARDAARLAHKAYDLATLAYRAGASTNIEVLDAARQARDADTSTAEAEDLSRQARLDLLVAAGRFP